VSTWASGRGPRESRESWVNVFRDLTQRGLEGVEYVVSDEHAGLVQALGLYFPEAAHQRCQVHYVRNALSHVSTDALRADLLTGLKDASHTREGALSHGTADRHDAREEGAWRGRLARGDRGPDARVLHPARGDAQTAAQEHQQRRARSRGGPPPNARCEDLPERRQLLRLTSALATERNEKLMERRYLSMTEAPHSETELRQTA
jgi:putative transposase